MVNSFSQDVRVGKCWASFFQDTSKLQLKFRTINQEIHLKTSLTEVLQVRIKRRSQVKTNRMGGEPKQASPTHMWWLKTWKGISATDNALEKSRISFPHWVPKLELK